MKCIGLILLILLAACGADAPSKTVNNNKVKVDLGDNTDTSKTDVGVDVSVEDAQIDMTIDPTPCGNTGDCELDEICKFNPATGASFCETKTGSNNGETCVSSDECASGVCLNGSCADLCSGEADCPAGFTCTAESVPTPNGDVELSLCTEEATPCLASADCPNGLICVLTDAGALECQVGDGGNVGEACTTNMECASNLCVDDLCSAPCQRPTDCSADGSFICVSRMIGNADQNVCVPRPASQCLTDSDCTMPERCVASKSATDIEFSCGNPNANGKDSGEACAVDTDCSQNLCVDNICAGPCQGNGDCSNDATCDLVNVDVGNGNTDSVQICAPPVLCDEKSKCRVNETCYVREAVGQTDIFCRAPNVGAGSLGQVCSISLECGSNFCLSTRFRNVCSEVCNDNSDCNVAGYTCQPFTFADGTNAETCQPSTPPSCTSNNDCATGTICSFVENEAGTGVETLCVPSTGGDAAGVACQVDDDCASLICLSGFCSAPCVDATQCPGQQLCETQDVTIGNNTNSFSLCTTPPVTPCAESSDCVDGVRVCSLSTDANGNPAGFCDFPNAGGAQMGSTCSMSSDCRENVCLTNISDECSVVCNDDSDCSSGLGCTTYGDVGFCNSVCSDSADCGAGQICTINPDTIANDVDQVCQNAIANGSGLGSTCATGSDCANGLCLTTTAFNQTACTTNANCAAGETCECPIDQPNCNTGKFCATQEQFCTDLCNDAADCPATGGNILTACSANTVVQLPNGQGTKTLATCAQP